VFYKKPKHVLYVQELFPKELRFGDNVEKYSTAGLATRQYNMAYALCMLGK
jgi:hypothetical protein